MQLMYKILHQVVINVLVPYHLGFLHDSCFKHFQVVQDFITTTGWRHVKSPRWIQHTMGNPPLTEELRPGCGHEPSPSWSKLPGDEKGDMWSMEGQAPNPLKGSWRVFTIVYPEKVNPVLFTSSGGCLQRWQGWTLKITTISSGQISILGATSQ